MLFLWTKWSSWIRLICLRWKGTLPPRTKTLFQSKKKEWETTLIGIFVYVLFLTGPPTSVTRTTNGVRDPPDTSVDPNLSLSHRQDSSRNRPDRDPSQVRPDVPSTGRLDECWDSIKLFLDFSFLLKIFPNFFSWKVRYENGGSRKILTSVPFEIRYNSPITPNHRETGWEWHPYFVGK